jgi:chromosome segregation ATPase
MDEGFIDLRHSGDYSSGSDSFWPSFTDIMMVVVMIFMITSTILMLRNWELVRELRATIAAELEAEALARSATETSETLEERLAQAQHEISVLRMQMMRSKEQSQKSARLLAETQQQVRTLESARQGLQARLQQSTLDLRLARENLQQTQEELARLNAARASLQGTITELEQRELERSDELAALRAQYAESEMRLTDLQGNYDELNVKYNKLIKPARTAAGKYLVSVRYSKENGKYLIEFKTMEEDDYETLGRKELDRRLAALKKEYAGQLYVKVIIPKDSGLSYNEAWGFTQDVLTSYDYYYQD